MFLSWKDFPGYVFDKIRKLVVLSRHNPKSIILKICVPGKNLNKKTADSHADKYLIRDRKLEL